MKHKHITGNFTRYINSCIDACTAPQNSNTSPVKVNCCRAFIVRCVILICSTTLLSASIMAGSKQIAITFDDAPRPAGLMMGAEQRTAMLIQALKSANVSGAMFFATTNNLKHAGEEGAKRLAQYVAAGHLLGNHSHTHQSASRLSPKDFLADITIAHQRLQQFAGYQPYLRFPYLREGSSIQSRDAIRQGLAELGLSQGYVTIDNYDWYLQALLEESLAANIPFNIQGWRKLYVDILLQAAEHYAAIAEQALGRSPAHVLLLHENSLAAMFIDDLVAALRQNGWQIISALEAYKDPIAKTLPDTLFLGQGRVAAMAEIKGMARRNIRLYAEDEAVLRGLAVKAGLSGLAEGAYLGEQPPGLQAKKFAAGKISLADRYEYAVSFSADGRELFFGVAQANHRGEIFSARYKDGAWTPARKILHHPSYSFADPFLSRDGTRLYFISTTPSSAASESNDYDLWYVKRSREGWSDLINLGGDINSPMNDYYVSFTDNGTLAFASERDAATAGDFNIYLSQGEGDGFSPPKALAGDANTQAYEADPFIAPDGSYILFSSARPGGKGQRDIYVSFAQANGQWSKGVALGNGVNTPELEFCPSVTRDGRYLFYTSNQDLYWVDAAVIELARAQLDPQPRAK